MPRQHPADLARCRCPKCDPASGHMTSSSSTPVPFEVALGRMRRKGQAPPVELADNAPPVAKR